MSRFRETLPFRVLATDNFEKGVRAWPVATAIRMREIAPDPNGWLSAIRIDVDRDDGGTSWLDAGLPVPSLIVRNRANGHAHLSWLLSGWVRASDHRAVAYARKIRNALTDAVGGDRAYCGRFQHNPLCGTFDVTEGPPGYELSDLACHVDLFAERAKSTPYQELGDKRGRNKSLFDLGRGYAYEIVRGYRMRDNRTAFDELVAAYLAAENFNLARPLPESEIRTLHRSITGWTWKHYAKVTRLRPPRYRKNRESYLREVERRRDQVQQLALGGRSTKEICEELGIPRRTVQRYAAGIQVLERSA